ncbi:GNAT family N-acetyltransferase [Schleiferilactobacillus harbinensis]|uniref:GNAT family N-acetyltransferase n=1 Tax=Schleiferilactobacillus harbinensis TaxID=304207 RepID=A0ABU7T0K0_9LACO|nr:GNAT family N-acetyltransferase [Schleiferilactobacillus harbinensis]MCI1687680.1 GNAT family N-acetyltransferase [Schleiferilactobacillus harbinensis]MCI1783384.1 GNAT family N-acetyltransferase [Schleiferilactobacillus harbinensis]MCI1849735.1 GNAT family N-acetyltransferase [Schleiferilactobacillus harbinensis]
MLRLKATNAADAEQEFAAITALQSENGFTNKNYGISRQEFLAKALPAMLNAPQGIDLPAGFVPETDFFLWADDTIVGLFRVRHYLTPALRNGAGHIGYAILPAYRGHGYANTGLALTLREAARIVPEEHIYLSVHKDNPASLAVQLKNGATIWHENDTEYFTRIKKSAIQ